MLGNRHSRSPARLAALLLAAVLAIGCAAPVEEAVRVIYFADAARSVWAGEYEQGCDGAESNAGEETPYFTLDVTPCDGIIHCGEPLKVDPEDGAGTALATPESYHCPPI
jgi:hypothetical protein